MPQNLEEGVERPNPSRRFMTAPAICEQCGAKCAADAEFCPSCLLSLGISAKAASAPSSDSDAPSSEEIAEHFPQLEILGVLGEGGMGVVYKARQTKLDRFVALKILSPRIAEQFEFKDRFLREARALARLTHPNIVAVFDFGETDGLCWLLMEYVDGIDLRGLLKSGKLTPDVGLQLVPEMCAGLQYAHDHGVVHRDIKPENVLLDEEGHVKIADFGLAKLVSLGADELSLTRAEQVMGTPQYMAPEQMRSTKEVDHRADIYSLGVVFYEILTGDLPMGRFEAPSQRVAVDVKVDEIVLRTLERSPELRYQHVRDVKTDVDIVNVGRAAGLGSEISTPADDDGQEAATYQAHTMVLGLCGSIVLWLFLKWMFVAGIGGLNFNSWWGVGTSIVLLGALAMWILRRRSSPELREEPASSGPLRKWVRLSLSAMLFGMALLMLFGGMVESWDRSSSTYHSSRPHHRYITL
ncbi:MAG TPA: serine/threonine protein kinase, partial [Gemmatimonadetes bacterium]|nr:serine/threonine protein kinase [Gemmatimonadota bacterium]